MSNSALQRSIKPASRDGRSHCTLRSCIHQIWGTSCQYPHTLTKLVFCFSEIFVTIDFNNKSAILFDSAQFLAHNETWLKFQISLSDALKEAERASLRYCSTNHSPISLRIEPLTTRILQEVAHKTFGLRYNAATTGGVICSKTHSCMLQSVFWRQQLTPITSMLIR